MSDIRNYIYICTNIGCNKRRQINGLCLSCSPLPRKIYICGFIDPYTKKRCTKQCQKKDVKDGISKCYRHLHLSRKWKNDISIIYNPNGIKLEF